MGNGFRCATGPSSCKNSETSRTLALKASALSAYSGSSRSRYPYSFIVEPQPAALTITLSNSRSSKVSMVLRAKSRDSSSRPAWVERAPQHPCSGAMTSQPSAARTRTVAAFTGEKKTLCTQPGRDALHDAGLSELVPDAEALVEAHRGGDDPKAVRVGEEPEDHVPESLVVRPPLVAALDLPSRGLDELVVLNARRAGRDAGHAAEAEVEVADHLVVHRLLIEPLVHEVDATARGIHLLPEEDVGRAGRQKDTA